MIILHRIHGVHDVVRYEDKTVHRRTASAKGLLRLFQNADDLEDLVADHNLFVERFISRHKFFGNIIADDCDFDVVLVFGFTEETPACDGDLACTGVSGPDAAHLRRADLIAAELYDGWHSRWPEDG